MEGKLDKMNHKLIAGEWKGIIFHVNPFLQGGFFAFFSKLNVNSNTGSYYNDNQLMYVNYVRYTTLSLTGQGLFLA